MEKIFELLMKEGSYFYTLLRHTVCRGGTGQPSCAWTDGSIIYWDEVMWHEMFPLGSDKLRAAIISHELAHIYLGHTSKRPLYDIEDEQAWVVACELLANRYIPFREEVLGAGAVVDEMYEDKIPGISKMNEYQAYLELKKLNDQQKQDQNGEDEAGDAGDAGDGGQDGAQSGGKPQPGQGIVSVDAEACGATAETIKQALQSGKASSEFEGDPSQRLYEEAKKRPLEFSVDELLRLIRSYAEGEEVTGQERSYKRLRTVDRDVVLRPGKINQMAQRPARLLIALDNSGSMSSADFEMMKGVYKMLVKMSPRVDTIFFADKVSRVYSVQEMKNVIKERDWLHHENVGCGTNFQAVLRFMKEGNYRTVLNVGDGQDLEQTAIDKNWIDVVVSEVGYHKTYVTPGRKRVYATKD